MMNKSSYIKGCKVDSKLCPSFPPTFDFPFPRSNHFAQFTENFYSHTDVCVCVFYVHAPSVAM